MIDPQSHKPAREVITGFGIMKGCCDSRDCGKQNGVSGCGWIWVCVCVTDGGDCGKQDRKDLGGMIHVLCSPYSKKHLHQPTERVK